MASTTHPEYDIDTLGLTVVKDFSHRIHGKTILVTGPELDPAATTLVAERGYQLHDLFHVLTGYDTSPLGEIRVVSFTVAQTPAPYPALTIAMRLLQSSLYRPELLPVLLDATAEGWALGRRAKPLISVHWEEHWERPLEELRAEYDLA